MTLRMRASTFLGALTALWLVLALGAGAAIGGEDLYWILPGTGNAWDAINWNPQDVPDPDDRLFFDVSANYTVGFNTAVAQSAEMSFSDGNVSLVLLDPHETGEVLVGYDTGHDVVVGIDEGAMTGETLWVADGDCTGYLAVTGSDSSYTQATDSADDLIVGRNGGQATVLIDSGGQVTIGDDISVGVAGGSSGELTVTGREHNGVEYVRSSLIADSAGQTNMLTVASGDGSSGTVTITDHGLVQVDTVRVGTTGTTGSAVVVVGGGGGTGTLEIAGELYIGTAGISGSVTVNTAGQVTVGGTTSVGRLSDGTGELVVDGGTLRTQSLDINETGTFEFDHGSVHIEGGSFLMAPGLGLTVGGNLYLNDGAVGDATGNDFHFGTATWLGLMSIADGSSLITGEAVITGSIPNSSSVFVIGEHAGTGAGSRWEIPSDELAVGLGGAGDLNVEDGGTVVVGDRVRIGDDPDGLGIVVVAGNSSDGGRSTLDVGESLNIGGTWSGATGYLTVSNGGLVRTGSSVYVGSGGGLLDPANARVRVLGVNPATGDRSTLDTEGTLWIGDYATCEVTVENGGLIDVAGDLLVGEAGPASVVSVSGVAGSGERAELIVAGLAAIADYSDGSVTVADGGSFSALSLLMGWHGIASGELTVEGTAGGQRSVATVSRGAVIGSLGTGTVRVAGGGELQIANQLGTNETILGENGLGVGIVTVEGCAADGTPSAWHNGRDLVIGRDGQGIVIVREGGQVFAGDTQIARNADSTGSLNVSGAGSLVSAASLAVGGSDTAPGGEASVTIGTDATVDVAGALKIWNTGTVNSCGTLRVGSLGGDANPGALAFCGGTLDVAGGLSLGVAGPLYPVISLDATRHLHVGGTTVMDGNTLIAIDGGSFSTGALINGGSFEFNAGSFSLTNSSLVVGAGRLLGDDLLLEATRSLSVAGTTTVEAGATLTVDGGSLATGSLDVSGSAYLHSHAVDIDTDVTVQAGGRLFVGAAQSVDVDAAITNAGRIELMGSGARLGNGGWLDNSGVITGDGEIARGLRNLAGGEVRVGAGKRLLFSRVNADNEGTISLQGGTVEFTASLTNAAGADILGRGSLIAHGGLTNHGDLALSNGVTDVYGDLTNGAGGRVIVSGQADVTFWDDVLNAGSLFKVQADSSATFFGEYSGAGISGDGAKYFEDGVTPGFSPAVIGFGGDVTFGPAAELNIELADPNNADPLSPRYDALAVAGDVALAGTLSLDWLAVPGDPNSTFGGTYTILAYGGSRDGAFDTVTGEIAAYLDESVFPDGIEYDDAAGEVKLHLLDLLDGDADLDGLVGRDDLLDLRTGHETGGTGWALGDFDFNGVVNSDDYLIWKANVGTHVPGAVPEPGAAALVALGALAGLLRRRRSGS